MGRAKRRRRIFGLIEADHSDELVFAVGQGAERWRADDVTIASTHVAGRDE